MVGRCAAVLLVAAVLALGTSACSTTPTHTSVAKNGIALSVSLTKQPVAGGQRCAVNVSLEGISHKPFQLVTPSGRLVEVRATSVPDGRVVFESRQVDKQALTQFSGGGGPGPATTLEWGETFGVVYDFTVGEPGRYLVSVSTLGPVVNAPRIAFNVP